MLFKRFSTNSNKMTCCKRIENKRQTVEDLRYPHNIYISLEANFKDAREKIDKNSYCPTLRQPGFYPAVQFLGGILYKAV